MMDNLILLMAPGEGEGGGTSMLFLLMIVVVFYFFMIRPQMKKQKELRKYRESIQKGDKIVTTGGIYGKVADIRENVLIIEVEDKMRIRIDKNAVLKDPTDIQKAK